MSGIFLNATQISSAASNGGASLPLLTPQWEDHIVNNISWLRADTFSWQDGGVYQAAYQHLVDEMPEPDFIVIDNIKRYRDMTKDQEQNGTQYYAWGQDLEYPYFTLSSNPTTGATIYRASDGQPISQTSDSITQTRHASQTQTINGITITYYVAADKHRICLPDQLTKLVAIYQATGVAWFYVLDIENTRFKLPRSKHNKYASSVPVVGNGRTISYNAYPSGTQEANLCTGNVNGYAYVTFGGTSGMPLNSYIKLSENPDNTGMIIQQEQDTDQYKYLYFYVGNFTQTAIENTAGLNAEQFNAKADVDLANVLANIDFVVESQLPTEGNNYTWYRKFKSGWVEQGGISSAVNGVRTTATVTLPVTMADANYSLYVTITRGAEMDYRDQFLVGGNRTTTGFMIYSNWAGSDRGSTDNFGQWEVKGMAA